MMVFQPIESPERVTKVGNLARKLVWMVWMIWLRFGHLLLQTVGPNYIVFKEVWISQLGLMLRPAAS